MSAFSLVERIQVLICYIYSVRHFVLNQRMLENNPFSPKTKETEIEVKSKYKEHYRYYYY